MAYILFEYCGYTIAFSILVFFILQTRRPKLPYPPGPKGLPVIGNIRDVPPRHEWKTYREMSRQFNSDIIYLNLFGTDLIILNSYDVAFELLEKRSSIYSDRPRMPMLVELVGWGIGLTFMSYGPEWRLHRKIFHKHFNVNVVNKFSPKMFKTAHEMLYRLAHDPEHFMEHTSLLAASLSIDIAYGIDIQSGNDPCLTLVKKSLESVIACVNPGSFLVDSIPILKHVPEWFPGASFKQRARQWRKDLEDAAHIPFKLVKDRMATGGSPSCVVSQYLEELEDGCDRVAAENDIRGAATTIYAAGYDTTVSTLRSFFLAMTLFPDVFRRAQEEVDRVIGRDRLPEISDQPSLPYICAIVHEVLRWSPPVPSGVPHRLIISDVFQGKYIPAGATVLPNSWAILHDERLFGPYTESFNPDRFLSNGELNSMVQYSNPAFGFGRRICPGQYLVFSALFLNFACTVSAFDISKATDGNGNVITPNGEYTSGFTVQPLPFKCRIKPRSAQALDLVEEAYAIHHA